MQRFVEIALKTDPSSLEVIVRRRSEGGMDEYILQLCFHEDLVMFPDIVLLQGLLQLEKLQRFALL